jgi:hypothetical protein
MAMQKLTQPSYVTCAGKRYHCRLFIEIVTLLLNIATTSLDSYWRWFASVRTVLQANGTILYLILEPHVVDNVHRKFYFRYLVFYRVCDVSHYFAMFFAEITSGKMAVTGLLYLKCHLITRFQSSWIFLLGKKNAGGGMMLSIVIWKDFAR